MQQRGMTSRESAKFESDWKTNREIQTRRRRNKTKRKTEVGIARRSCEKKYIMWWASMFYDVLHVYLSISRAASQRQTLCICSTKWKRPTKYEKKERTPRSLQTHRKHGVLSRTPYAHSRRKKSVQIHVNSARYYRPHLRYFPAGRLSLMLCDNNFGIYYCWTSDVYGALTTNTATSRANKRGALRFVFSSIL